jgi:hypothetical protein
MKKMLVLALLLLSKLQAETYTNPYDGYSVELSDEWQEFHWFWDTLLNPSNTPTMPFPADSANIQHWKYAGEDNLRLSIVTRYKANETVESNMDEIKNHLESSGQRFIASIANKNPNMQLPSKGFLNYTVGDQYQHSTVIVNEDKVHYIVFTSDRSLYSKKLRPVLESVIKNFIIDK